MKFVDNLTKDRAVIDKDKVDLLYQECARIRASDSRSIIEMCETEQFCVYDARTGKHTTVSARLYLDMDEKHINDNEIGFSSALFVPESKFYDPPFTNAVRSASEGKINAVIKRVTRDKCKFDSFWYEDHEEDDVIVRCVDTPLHFDPKSLSADIIQQIKPRLVDLEMMRRTVEDSNLRIRQ